MAFGALIIKQKLNLSDEDTVLMIRENSHCQYFLGMNEFTNNPPFDSSKVIAFSKRFPASAMAEINEAINEAIIAKDHKDLPPADDNNDGDDGNSGTLILDATCAPADILLLQTKNIYT